MNSCTCEGCGHAAPNHDTVHYGSNEDGYRLLCTGCFNMEVAARAGLAHFENVRLEPITVNDCDGIPHQFHFRVRLLGKLLSLDAFELHDGEPSGYQLQLVGAPDEELFGMVGRMVEKIRRTLAVKHIASGKYGLEILDQCVKGRIDSDELSDGQRPLLIIDGRPVTWDQLGSMLMSFEGWQVKLELLDPSDEA